MSANDRDRSESFSIIDTQAKTRIFFAKPATAPIVEQGRTKSADFQSYLNHEHLLVEELDENSNDSELQARSCTYNPQKRLNSSQPICSDAISNAISRRDFTVYEGGDLNDFFSCDTPQSPERVSDVCLVNDHYILVKLPQMERRDSQIKCILEEDEEHTDQQEQQQEASLNNRKQRATGGGFGKYLQYGTNRSRRISPIPGGDIAENAANIKIPENNSWLKNGSDQETFRSRTIIKRNQSSLTKCNVSFKQTPVVNSAIGSNQSFNASTEQLIGIAAPVQTQIKQPFYARKSEVELELHGRLETLRDDLECNVPFKLQSSCDINTAKETLPRPRRPLGFAIRWFLKPFRTRPKSKKSTAPKKKIHAVVYKTFFINLTKSPDQVPKGSMPLRRCRSAFF